MANAGTVTVDFAAEVAKFNAQLKQVNDRVKSVESGFKTLAKTAETALKFFSIGIAARWVQSAGEAADAIGKMADKLGIATQRLVAFQLAADDAGVQTETLNKLLTDAERKLGEASSFKGGTFAAISQLGLDIRELQRLSPDELFLRYADALSTVKNRSEQFALAQDLFGKSATEAFNLIEAGRPAIEKAAANVEKFGLALDRIDTAKIEAANDALGLLSKTSQAFGQHVAAAFAPFTEEIARRLTEAGGAANKAQSQLETFAKAVFVTFEIVSNAVNVFDAAVSGAFFAISKGIELAIGALRKSFELTAKLDEAVGLDSLAKRFRDFAQSAGEAQDFAAAFSEQAAQRVKNAADGIKSFGQIFDEANELVAKAQATAEEAAAKAAENNAGLGLVAGPETIEKIRASQAALEELQTQHFDILLSQQLEFQARSADLADRLDVQQFVRQQKAKEDSAIAVEANILAARQRAFNSSEDLLQALSARSKAAAIALIAINKAVSIAQAIQNTSAAVTKTLAVYGGTPAGYAAAASIKAWGAIEVATIAATGIAQIASITSSPGRGAPAGSPANPLFTTRTSDTLPTDQTPGASARPVQTINVYGWSEQAIRDLMRLMRETGTDYDVQVIRN